MDEKELAALLQQAIAAGATGGGEDPDDPPMWLSHDAPKHPVKKGYSKGAKSQPKTKGRTLPRGTKSTANGAMSWLYGLLQKPDELKALIAKIEGLTGEDINSFDDLEKIWAAYVSKAANYHKASDGKNIMTPLDIMEMEADPANGFTSGRDKDGNKTQTSTQTNFRLFSEGEAKGLMRSTLRDAIGRDPSKAEVAEFMDTLNAAARARPSVSKSVVTQDKDGNTTTRNEDVSTGFTNDDAAGLALDRAEDHPEYGAFQASTTYMDALMSALGPVTG